MMKRWAILMTLLVWGTCFFCTPAATAQGRQTLYTIKDLGLSLKIPSSYQVDIIGEAPMPGGDVYLVGKKEQYEIRVRVGSNEEIRQIGNLTERTIEEKEEYARSLVENINLTNVYQVTNWRIEEKKNVTMLRLEMESISDSMKDYGIEYYTIANGKRLTLSLHNYEHPIGAEQKEHFAGMVEKASVAEWAGIRSAEETTAVTKTLETEEMKVALQLPETWKETETKGKYSNEEGEYIFVACQEEQDYFLQILMDSEIGKMQTGKDYYLVSFLYDNGEQNIIASFLGLKDSQGHQDFLHMTENIYVLQEEMKLEAEPEPVVPSRQQQIASAVFGLEEAPENTTGWAAAVVFYLFFYTLIFLILRLIAGKARLKHTFRIVLPYMIVTVGVQAFLGKWLHTPSIGWAVLFCGVLNFLILCVGKTQNETKKK